MPGTIVLVIVLILASVATLLFNRNAIKLVIALTIFEGAIFLFGIGSAYVPGGVAPIVGEGGVLVNPLPHALVLTAIVIAASTTALSLSMLINLFQYTRSLNLNEMRELKG